MLHVRNVSVPYSRKLNKVFTSEQEFGDVLFHDPRDGGPPMGIPVSVAIRLTNKDRFMNTGCRIDSQEVSF